LQGQWPWIGAFCGDIDLIGHQKPQSFARDVAWGLSALEVLVQRPVPDGLVEKTTPWGWSDEQPSWTWPGAEGKPLAVRVYSSGDRVELSLNGKVVAAKSLAEADHMRAEFQVAYAPGTLEAIAYRGGTEIARRQLKTAGPPAAVRLTPEPRGKWAGLSSLAYVGIEIVDARGDRVPDAELDLALKIDGAAELIALGSANPKATSGFQSSTAKTWDGRALAILRSRGNTGDVRVTAESPKLASGSARFTFS
jgi:beta-galactosidase